MSHPKNKVIFRISVENGTTDAIFIKIGLELWKPDDPMLNLWVGYFSLAATVLYKMKEFIYNLVW